MDILLEAAPGGEHRGRRRLDRARQGRPGRGGSPKFGDRIVAIHVKDIAPAGENADEGGWADAGHGVVPWKTLWPHRPRRPRPVTSSPSTTIPADIDRFASRSIAFVKSLGA